MLKFYKHKGLNGCDNTKQEIIDYCKQNENSALYVTHGWYDQIWDHLREEYGYDYDDEIKIVENNNMLCWPVYDYILFKSNEDKTKFIMKYL